MAKEQREHITLLCIPARGRMLPHSGQKFGSPAKHDIPAGGQSVRTLHHNRTQQEISLGLEREHIPLLVSDQHNYRGCVVPPCGSSVALHDVRSGIFPTFRPPQFHAVLKHDCSVSLPHHTTLQTNASGAGRT